MASTHHPKNSPEEIYQTLKNFNFIHNDNYFPFSHQIWSEASAAFKQIPVSTVYIYGYIRKNRNNVSARIHGKVPKTKSEKRVMKRDVKPLTRHSMKSKGNRQAHQAIGESSINNPAASIAPRINVSPLKEFFQEDKLKFILDTLANENCSAEYIDRVRKLCNSCTYLMLHKLESDCDAESMRVRKAGPTPPFSDISEVHQGLYERELENVKEYERNRTSSMKVSSLVEEGNRENNSAKREDESKSLKRMKRMRRSLSNTSYKIDSDVEKSSVTELPAEKKRSKLTIKSIETVSINLNGHSQQKSSSSSTRIEPHDTRMYKKKYVARQLPMADRLKSLGANQKFKKSVNSAAKMKKNTDTVEKETETKMNVKNRPSGWKITEPKRITAWVPKILKKPDNSYGLIFEGQLLNEAGHSLCKKYATDFVMKRITPKIIQTESHIIYELIGDLCDSKCTVPKELTKQCFNRCPMRIKKFCEQWRYFVMKNDGEITLSTVDDVLNASIDMEKMPTSSRGRKIMPPLCYWTGERVVLKDNESVYNPGNSQDSSFTH